MFCKPDVREAFRVQALRDAHHRRQTRRRIGIARIRRDFKRRLEMHQPFTARETRQVHPRCYAS